MKNTKVFAGIDVSKGTLDIAFRPEGKSMTVDNDDDGIKELCKHLKKETPELIVFEATGGRETLAASTLAT